MTPHLKTASCIPNPDEQVWELLVPSPPNLHHTSKDDDDVEKMIENGED